MLKIPIEEIIEKIQNKTGLDKSKIEEKINAKMDEHGGLVSKEGAAHIIANEFGVKLFKQTSSGRLQIKNIIPGLRSVSFVGRVVRIFPVKSYKTEKRQGKIGSFLVADETGRIRVVFWDTNQIKVIEDGQMKEGDVIRLTSCYVKEGLKGQPEVHASSRSKLDVDPDIPEAKKIPSLSELSNTAQRVKISDVQEGFAEIRGAIVNFVGDGSFYEVCPKCNKKVYNNSCNEHGEVDPKHALVVSALLDDGTDNIRVVFFRKQAEKLIGSESEELYSLGESNNDLSYGIKEAQKELLGKDLVVEGRVSNNDYSGELEMIARRISFTNPSTEAKKLASQLE